jgi:hypothetical protein
MAWTSPYTAISGSMVSAAQFNQYIRDNLLVSEAAACLTPGSFPVTSAANAVVERLPATATVATGETVTSATYADPATPGPSVTCATGTIALVIVGGRIGPNTVATPSTKMSWEVSGATTIAASDTWAAGMVNPGTTTFAIYTSRWFRTTSLTPGNNTFKAKYAASSGTATYTFRSIHVIPF